MSYFGPTCGRQARSNHSFHIVPHSFLCKVYIEAPAVFTHRKLVDFSKRPTGILLRVTMLKLYTAMCQSLYKFKMRQQLLFTT